MAAASLVMGCGLAAAQTYTGAPGAATWVSKQGISGWAVQGGATGDEIDVGETLTASFAGPVLISAFSLGVLYDGPEFGDPHEKAQFTAFLGGQQVGQWTFTATGTTTGVLSGPGSYLNLSPAAQPGAGLWQIADPFGKLWVDKIQFTALSQSRYGNNSDYIVSSVTAVPEPGSVVLMLAGLGAVGFVARRRKDRA
ncbi:PEP-CTERM sorting domain-containing protein [Rivibacter subsaxonicus]|uniref:PEP-CTERM sorting domain-containing protein n=1 Tax=Rivibacter subsaxonicus TaxID=457575 RepID=UPI0013EE9C22|nr:PEP-CTERM sorting domain-containing protein [Rivibacter subsaxonicus]